MNIVLLIFDTLRKDCVGVYGEPPWGKVHTLHLDALASESVIFNRFYPEALPTLPARRAIYTGQRVYPFHKGDFRLKGDFIGAPGWGPIPEDQDTIAEILRDIGGYRTGLISDVHHQFKPSKNFTRGFDQWAFLRGQETDPYRSGPYPTQDEINYWLAPELHELPANLGGRTATRVEFVRQALMNTYGRNIEEDYFNAQVMTEAVHWLEENQDADKFFLTIECFDPHEPWFVPEHYRRLYSDEDGQEHIISMYGSTDVLSTELLNRAQANYSGLITMCDRWFGYLYESLQALGRLNDTVLIVMSDHGHAMGERGDYMGKRGYPSEPAVFDNVLFVRHPDGIIKHCDFMVQHTDIPAQILEFAGVESIQPLDGRPFWNAVVEDQPTFRDHITVGWSGAITVINDDWWMNCKVDGTGPFLYALDDFECNLADDHPEVVRDLYQIALDDADGNLPEYLLELAKNEADAPGCSALAARA